MTESQPCSAHNGPYVKWAVSINQGQRDYIVTAPTAREAAMTGDTKWRADDTVTPKQRGRGIYDIRVRHAKFGEVKDQLVIPVDGDDRA